MVAIVGILITALLIAWLEVPLLLKKKQKKELFLFTCLLLLGAGMGIAESLHFTIPSPLKVVEYVYGPIGRMVDSLLS